MPGSRDALIGLGGALGGAIIGGGFTWYGTHVQHQDAIAQLTLQKNQAEETATQANLKAAQARQERDKLRGQIRDAAHKFTDQMDRMIVELQGAVDLSQRAPRDGNPQLIGVAREVVAARNDFASILNNIIGNLNNEFSGVTNALTSGTPDMEELRRASRSLIRAWPAKKEKLNSGIEIFLNKVGIVGM